jgi:hypothetical protein
MTIMSNDRTEWTAPELLAAEFPARTTARELIASGECWAQCLLALTEDDKCDCPCGGSYHGVIADVKVEKRPSVDGWWSRAGYSEWFLSTHVPTLDSRRGVPVRLAWDPDFGSFGVWRQGSRWEGTFDLARPRFLDDRMKVALTEVGCLLLRSGRARHVCVAKDIVLIYGARSAFDAKAFLFIAIELLCENFDGYRNVLQRF